jgi:hypothetical protein
MSNDIDDDDVGSLDSTSFSSVWPFDTSFDTDILTGDLVDVGSLDSTTFSSTWPEESKVTIDEQGVTLTDDADIVINGKSLTQTLNTLEERLLILQPDFEMMEQYPALKAAYEQYKLIEKLLRDGQKRS